MHRKTILRQKRRELGLCTECGNPPKFGLTPSKIKYSRCEICIEKTASKIRDYKRKLHSEGKCECGKPQVSDRSMCHSCLSRTRTCSLRQSREYRQKVIEAYGGACKCCGITVEKYLQLDHVNNDGNAHRKEMRGYNNGGLSYSWACQNGFPPILQLLCANCHQAKSNKKPCTSEDHLRMFARAT